VEVDPCTAAAEHQAEVQAVEVQIATQAAAQAVSCVNLANFFEISQKSIFMY